MCKCIEIYELSRKKLIINKLCIRFLNSPFLFVFYEGLEQFLRGFSVQTKVVDDYS